MGGGSVAALRGWSPWAAGVVAALLWGGVLCGAEALAYAVPWTFVWVLSVVGLAAFYLAALLTGRAGLAVLITVIGFVVCAHYGVQQQALHDRGRVEQAVVASVRPNPDADDTSATIETVRSASGRPIPGTLKDDTLSVGQRVTVTVDLSGRSPLREGGKPASAAGTWLAAAGALFALQLALAGYLAARYVRYLRTRPAYLDIRPARQRRPARRTARQP